MLFRCVKSINTTMLEVDCGVVPLQGNRVTKVNKESGRGIGTQVAEINGIAVKRKPFANTKEGRGIGTHVAETNGIAVKRKPFANTKRGEGNWNSGGRN